MDISKATNEQLQIIVKHDKCCPIHLLKEVSEEMMKREMWSNIIFYAAGSVFKNINFVLKQRLRMDHEELKQIGHIEIYRSVEKFKHGMRSFFSFVVMVLIAKFKKMIRDVNAEKRYSEIGTVNYEKLPEKVQDKLFCSLINIERHVINKIMLSEAFKSLRDVEIRCIELELAGYQQYEISEMLGFKKTYANVLLRRSYKKLRNYLEEVG